MTCIAVDLKGKHELYKENESMSEEYWHCYHCEYIERRQK
jgi:hypothetical protein